MFILEQRQLETKWAQGPPPAARSGSLRKAKALIRAAERRFECVCPAQALQSAGVRGQKWGCSAVFPGSGQVIKLRWWEGVTST